MTQTSDATDTSPIDAVITWVDGNAPRHRAQRRAFMAQTPAPLLENAVNPHRWNGSDEILYCLRSIENHASWVRTIWIVVDEGAPDLSGLSAALRSKVRMAYHRDIFAGFTDALPTFNSLAIESLLWRIDGLAERFLYFNDDVFVTAPLAPQDMFHGRSPVLRGRWTDQSRLPAIRDALGDPALFNHFMQINAAQLAGFDASRLFFAAHVVHPMLRSRMQALFQDHPDAFANNAAHRFRDLSQFLPQGLHNHACLRDDAAVIQTARDHIHIASGRGLGRPPAETLALLEKAATAEIRFLCINDLPQLEVLIPNTRNWIEHAIGAGPRPV